MQRFATVQEFWQAVQEESEHQPLISEALNSITVSPSTYVVPSKTGESATKPLQAKQVPGRRSREIHVLPVLFVLLMFVGIGIGASYWGFTVLGKNQGANGQLTVTPQHPAPTPSAHSTTIIPNLHLHQSYYGTITDLNANVPYQMILTHVRQNDGNISGSFSGLHMSGVFSGSVDTSKNITFIVTASSGGVRLYFTGSVKANGELGGQFFSIDQFNQIIPNDAFGVWSVAPPK